ncbi:MAG TPA: chromosomal replication initiator protein DnaA, partial [Clostridiales bacterium]|nr:chromosomal replication initiator protein DnaA [Clostridiales bacterium]
MERPDIRTRWQRALVLLESEMSEISLNTWIKPMLPVSAEQGVFVLSVPNEFHKTFVDQYVSLIRNTLKAAGSVEYEVRIVVGGSEAADRQAAALENGSLGSDTFGQISNSRLNSQYTFESFVVGSGNRFAHAACVAVAEKQGGRNFNPL